jgi:fatty-acid desaturase
MGREHDTTKYDCGCVYHHEYDEACGMGAIQGSSKEWWVFCRIHQLAMDDANNGPHNAYDSAYSRILYDIRGWERYGRPLDREALKRRLQ